MFFVYDHFLLHCLELGRTSPELHSSPTSLGKLEMQYLLLADGLVPIVQVHFEDVQADLTGQYALLSHASPISLAKNKGKK